MLVGYIRVSPDLDRQRTDLQRDALLVVGIDARHLFEDHAAGAKDDRLAWSKHWNSFVPVTCSSS